ncbi:hypothetical protein P7C73_g5622, partial [Tremellales sp. Uapishka_1]
MSPRCPHRIRPHPWAVIDAEQQSPISAPESSSLASLVSLEAILTGETKFPIGKSDLLSWLEYMAAPETTTGIHVLSALDAIAQYRSSFAALPREKRRLSPPPFQAISQLSLLEPDIMRNDRGRGAGASASASAETSVAVALPPMAATLPRSNSTASTLSVRPLPAARNFRLPPAYETRPDSSASDVSEKDLASGRGRKGGLGHRPCRSTHRHEASGLAVAPTTSDQFAKPPLLDPSLQPLRAALGLLTKHYLTDDLIALLPPALLTKFHSESALTTHPEVLDPLTAFLCAWLSDNLLPSFLGESTKNLHHRTAQGRLLVGIVCLVTSIWVTVLLLLVPGPFRPDGKQVARAWRLLLIPVLLGGIGYGMGARAGLCFWLALAGVREDQFDEAKSAVVVSTSTALKRRSELSTLLGRIGFKGAQRPSRKLRKQSASMRSETLELSLSQQPRSIVNATDSPSRRLFILLWRLTGTAWGVEKVQDPVLRRYQRGRAVKIVGWLILSLGIVSVVLWFLPYIPLARHA